MKVTWLFANQCDICGVDFYARLQRFRVRHGLICVIGPVWPVGASCYSQAALPMLSKPLYVECSAKMWAPGCENAAGKGRQKW